MLKEQADFMIKRIIKKIYLFSVCQRILYLKNYTHTGYSLTKERTKKH